MERVQGGFTKQGMPRHWQIIEAFASAHVSPDFLINEVLKGPLPLLAKVGSAGAKCFGTSDWFEFEYVINTAS